MEMSISPAMTTKVSPNASRPMKTYGVIRSSKFKRVRKNGDNVVLQKPTPTIATSSNVSQRTSSLTSRRLTVPPLLSARPLRAWRRGPGRDGVATSPGAGASQVRRL